VNRSLRILSLGLLVLPVVSVGQSIQPKPGAKKNHIVNAKSAPSAVKTVEQPSKKTFAELSIGELIAEDANRWSDKMATHVAVGGFITQVTKGDDGDTVINICENPKIEGMDRAHCIVAKCMSKLPCDVPQIGKPVTVKGITRYDAKVGTHWWEIYPVEQLDK
jgi:hypothetical protein